MLYQMLTGKLPRGQFKMPGELIPELDPRLDEIVSHSLQPDPDDRFSSASEMRLAMNPVLSAPMSRMQMNEQAEQKEAKSQANQVEEKKQTHVSRVTSSAKKTSKNGLYIGVAAAALLVIGGLVALALMSGDEKRGNDSTLASATKDEPFENSLGMRFVPVLISGGPSEGKTVLFSIWETRVKDYSAFIKEGKGRGWPKVDFPQTDDHPAVNVSWVDAQAFCKWLTEEERKKGTLGKDEHYRLPTDYEWNCAVGIGKMEVAEKTPADKNMQIDGVYPWGTKFPPPKGAGNYYGEETKRNPSTEKMPIEGYDDGFDRTAPVASFEGNEFGLYDLGGNVWEWCQDWHSVRQEKRVSRGNSWSENDERYLISAHRRLTLPMDRLDLIGLRLVVSTVGMEDSPLRSLNAP